MTTVFDKILDGELPCHRVFENEHVLAFLDIGPISRGHTLVIPKERVARMHELSDDAAAELGRALPRVARAVMAATGASDYNLLQNNGKAAHQEVMHVHVHVIPVDGEGRKLGIGWKGAPLEEPEALAASMRAALETDGGAA